MTRIPASIRNRNPGAMYPGRSAKLFGSTSHEVLRSKDRRHLIATFPTDEQGAAAMFDLLNRGYTGRTIEQAIAKWCGGYYVSTYLRVLEGAGITKDTILTRELVADPSKVVPLCQAMARQEAGREYPMTAEQWQEAHQLWRETVLEGWKPDNGNPTPSAEQKAAEASKTAAGFGGVAAVGGAAAAAPDIGWLSSWKGLGQQVSDIGAWAVNHWWLAIPLGLVGLVIYAARRQV